MSRSYSYIPAAVALLLAFAATGVHGQEPEPPAAQPPSKEVREQTIYIPFTQLREVFEKNGRGVFVPYEKFQELWKLAREKQAPVVDSKPPAAALITEIDNAAEVGAEVVTVTAKVSVEILQKGWHEIPLRLQDAAILSARLDDQPARIAAADDGYRLIIDKRGDDAERRELTLVYAKAFSKAPGQNRVSFQAPQAPVNRWRIRVPETGVKVNVQPLIAATQPPAEKEDAVEGADPPPVQETILLAFVGAAPTVTIDWTPKAEGATGLAALSTVQAEQSVTVDEGVVRTAAKLTYRIRRAELSQLTIEAPADHKVAGVFDPNVRQWDVEIKDDKQIITVQLFEPVRNEQSITVELERFTEDLQKQPLPIPVVRALNVGRQQGVLAVGLSNALRAEPVQRSGLQQLDAGELPARVAGKAAETGGKWNFAYRYAALPYQLNLQVEQVRPLIETQELVEAFLEPEQLTLDLLALFHVKRVGVFQLQFELPAGFDVRRVQGRAVAGATAAEVDSFNTEGDDKTRLVVNLSRRALGQVGLLIELHRRLEDANLLTPTGEVSEIQVPLPRVAAEGIEHSAGRLVVYAPESLRVNPDASPLLQTISIQEALKDLQSVRDGRFSLARPVFSYAYTRDAAELNVEVQRRKPHVTAGQLLEVKVESGVVEYKAGFFYDIRYSGVKSLRIDVPEDLAGELGDQARGRAIDPPPDDVAEGYVAWEMTGETEFIGSRRFDFSWQRKRDPLEVGKTVELEMPILRPRNVDRAWGQIVIAKAESLDIRGAGEPTGLRPIDPQQDLMPGASQATKDTAARAFEFHEDWKLRIEVTRYELEEVKRTSVEMAVVRMVVTRSDQISVQAMYRMRSARQRLVVKLPANVDPEKAFDAQPLRINGQTVFNGQPVRLERGDQGDYYIPLTNLNSDEPFVLELRYLAEGDESDLALPNFPNDPAVQKVYLCAYLPDERLLLGSRGDWTNEQHDGLSALFSGRPLYASNDQYLVDELISGLNFVGGGDFPTDGKLYIFSALRPSPPPDGTLRLTSIGDTWLYVMMFAAVGLFGLALLVRPAAEKFAGLGLLIAALIIVGALWPTFSAQLLNQYLTAALAVVLVIWCTRSTMLALRNRARLQQASREAAAATAATAASAAAAEQAAEPVTEESAAQQGEAGSPFGADGGDESPAPDEPPSGERQDGGPSDA